MLSPKPVLPFDISIVVSHPGIIGQVDGSEGNVAGVDDRLEPIVKKLNRE